MIFKTLQKSCNSKTSEWTKKYNQRHILHNAEKNGKNTVENNESMSEKRVTDVESLTFRTTEPNIMKHRCSY